ncbi:MAG: hypothetical protein QOJ99_5060, partial [Bryobacterales bacterium]|nr:hypothetical protein [Bryobacterales bacterium]
MADHLTSEMTDGYRARSLTTDELLAVTAHLADCEECRQSTASHHGTGKLLEALGDPHLSYESLEAIVHGGREGLDHVSDCAMCAEELKDLRAFYAGMRQSRPGTEPRGWRIGVLVPVGSLALAAIILTGILLRPGNKAADVSASQPYVGQPRALATLRDSGRVLALNETGAVIGMDELAPAERDQIAEVLRS